MYLPIFILFLYNHVVQITSKKKIQKMRCTVDSKIIHLLVLFLCKTISCFHYFCCVNLLQAINGSRALQSLNNLKMYKTEENVTPPDTSEVNSCINPAFIIFLYVINTHCLLFIGLIFWSPRHYSL
jgi:hypothetical protein